MSGVDLAERVARQRDLHREHDGAEHAVALVGEHQLHGPDPVRVPERAYDRAQVAQHDDDLHRALDPDIGSHDLDADRNFQHEFHD